MIATKARGSGNDVESMAEIPMGTGAGSGGPPKDQLEQLQALANSLMAAVGERDDRIRRQASDKVCFPYIFLPHYILAPIDS